MAATTPITLSPSAYTTDHKGELTENLGWYGPGGHHPTHLGDRTEMSEAWFVRQCAKLRRERNNDGDGELRQYAPENVHAITAEEMLAILGRPRIIKVTRELREEAIVEEWIGDDQVPRVTLWCVRTGSRRTLTFG
jgi:hypothetical protein